MYAYMHTWIFVCMYVCMYVFESHNSYFVAYYLEFAIIIDFNKFTILFLDLSF